MKPFAPGATLGILGGGQLGRMIAVEARRMGYRALCWDPVAGGPAQQVCDEAIVAPFEDAKAAEEFARKSDVITFEWENVPGALALKLSELKPVRPQPSVLDTIQDRLVQRTFLEKNGFAQADFAPVASRADVEAFDFPCIVKTRRHGYDGKGQAVLKTAADLPKADALLKLDAIVERFIPFEKEVSVILARGLDGQAAVYPLAENIHRDGILFTSLAPARIPLPLGQKAALAALKISELLGHVGVLAVEFFVKGDQVLVNEIAPRVHNSGHYTLGACQTNQFEQHARAVLGLPLGDPTPQAPALMINLLGDLWKNGEPRWDAVLSRPDAKLHLYGKAQAKPGRKMGHVTVLGEAALEPGLGGKILTALAAR